MIYIRNQRYECLGERQVVLKEDSLSRKRNESVILHLIAFMLEKIPSPVCRVYEYCYIN